MDDEIIKKLTDIKFAKKIVGLKTKKEVKKAFEDEGVEIPADQVDELGGRINLIVQEASKLPPEELEKISGGVWRWPFSHATGMDVVNNAMSQPGVAPAVVMATIGAIGAVGGGLLNLWASSKTPAQPPPPKPIISNEAMAGAAIVLAVVGSGYVISQLAKSGWFNKESGTSTKK